MDLSIVSGTYNRLKHLQEMIESARQSIGNQYGLEYEFVIVDGGSTDGSIDWLKSQSDVKLIEHGALLGAVKAFNDGAFAATGQYVILGNDDITFIGDSVLRAYIYMQNNPECGCGCFYQDRGRQELPDNDTGKWHVEGMPCVVNDQQVHLAYGQVCIVPKELGDKLGWWGDYLRTYGGDNELSANIWESGYTCDPVPETKIHDTTPDDELRKINNINGAKDPQAVRGHHPDSWAWGRKWRNPETGLVGPIVADKPKFTIERTQKNRVIYLPIFEQGWEIQKEQKRGLREALAKIGLVSEIDYVAFSDKNKLLALIAAEIKRLQPTFILTQLHNESNLNSNDVNTIKQLADCPIINWNGDYWPDNLLSEEGIRLASNFDLQLTINIDALEEYKRLGVNADYWQIGWEPDGVGHSATVNHDVVFLGNGYSQERRKFVKFLRSLDIDFGLYGQGWETNWVSGQNLYNFAEGCGVYQGAKISLGDSQWPDSGFVSNRVFQALAAGGAALAHQWFRGMDDLGLIDGETCIIWKSFDELKAKIDYYLQHEQERKAIAAAGQQLALSKHSFDYRVSELLNMLAVIELEKQDGWRW